MKVALIDATPPATFATTRATFVVNGKEVNITLVDNQLRIESDGALEIEPRAVDIIRLSVK